VVIQFYRNPASRAPCRPRVVKRLTGEIRPAIRNGDIAITSTVRVGNATVEVARRQPDGTWLWVIDQPSVLA
jgi:hypothetical protein